MSNDSGRLKSVRRSFEIIETLEVNEGMTMSELADEFDMPASTAYVYLQTLVDTGYVVQDDDDEYHLGFRFLKHGGYVRHRLDIYQAAKLEVNDLARRTGEVVDFGIMENGKRVLVYKFEGPEGVTQKPVTGDYAHLHMTALGKAMLATLSTERVAEIVDEHGLPKSTQYTIDDREDLFKELERTREQGYSVENQERREGIRAVGVSVKREDGPPAAVSISGPMSRFSDERIEELQAELHNTANVIQIRMRNY